VAHFKSKHEENFIYSAFLKVTNETVCFELSTPFSSPLIQTAILTYKSVFPESFLQHKVWTDLQISTNNVSERWIN